MTRVEKVQRLLDEATVAVRSLEDAAATEEIAVGLTSTTNNRNILATIESELSLNGGAGPDAPDAATILAEARREVG